MPSGPKKRKAAKKKKGNQPNNQSNPSSSVSTRSHEKKNVNHQGKEDLERQIKTGHDEAMVKSSDGGSSGSSSNSNSGSDNDIATVINPAKIANSSTESSAAKAIEHVPVKEANEDKVLSSATLANAALEKKEPIVKSVDNTAAILDPKKCVTQENDDRLTLLHNAPRANDDNEAENEKGVTEPLLAPSQLQVQKTSWKSCCGLFEVFSGSGS
ncbi:hypothetical protein ABFX02_13G089400 [Erythranthe guttata]